jgi:hypothetical protein
LTEDIKARGARGYAGEINGKNTDAFDRDTPIFENMATAAQVLIQVRP